MPAAETDEITQHSLGTAARCRQQAIAKIAMWNRLRPVEVRTDRRLAYLRVLGF